MCGLDAGEKARRAHGRLLLVLAQCIKLSAGVGLALDVLGLAEDTDAAADGNGSVLGVLAAQAREKNNEGAGETPHRVEITPCITEKANNNNNNKIIIIIIKQ